MDVASLTRSCLKSMAGIRRGDVPLPYMTRRRRPQLPTKAPDILIDPKGHRDEGVWKLITELTSVRYDYLIRKHSGTRVWKASCKAIVSLLQNCGMHLPDLMERQMLSPLHPCKTDLYLAEWPHCRRGLVSG